MPKVITRQYVELEGFQFEIGKEHTIPTHLLIDGSQPQLLSGNSWFKEAAHTWRLQSVAVTGMIQDILKHGQSHPVEFTVSPKGDLHLWDGTVRIMACHALLKPVKVIFTQR